MKAFVTGGTGFLGRRVVERLLGLGYEVRVLSRTREKGESISALGAEIVLGDLGYIDGFKASLSGCELVVMIGARAVSHGAWEEFVRENVLATERLIEEALAVGARRIVYVSSLGIFEIPKDGVTITEDTDYDHEPMLRGNYTRSKINADRIARAAVREGKPVVIVRPGRIYGHDHPLGQPLYLGRVKKRLGSRFCVVVGKASYLTPICYVENAADAIVAAATSPGVEGQSFNIVDDPDLTHRVYFRAVSQLRGFPRRYVFVPVGLLVPALIIVDLIHRVLRRRAWSVAYQLRRSGRSARYTTSAARTALSWRPRVGLDEALHATAVPEK